MTDTDPFTTPSKVRETGGPGPWFIAGFDGECPYGDMINEGDTIRADGDGGWEHKECWEADNDYGPPLEGDGWGHKEMWDY